MTMPLHLPLHLQSFATSHLRPTAEPGSDVEVDRPRRGTPARAAGASLQDSRTDAAPSGGDLADGAARAASRQLATPAPANLLARADGHHADSGPASSRRLQAVGREVNARPNGRGERRRDRLEPGVSLRQRAGGGGRAELEARRRDVQARRDAGVDPPATSGGGGGIRAARGAGDKDP